MTYKCEYCGRRTKRNTKECYKCRHLVPQEERLERRKRVKRFQQLLRGKK